MSMDVNWRNELQCSHAGLPGGSDSAGGVHLLIPIQQERVKEGPPATLLITELFPWWPLIKNPAANAGDTGSIPGPGGSHMLQSK